MVDWKTSAKRKGLGLLAADRLAGLAGVVRSHLITERLAKKTQDGTLDQETVEPMDEALAKMDIRVGDETHHYQPAPSGTAQSTSLPVLAVVAILAALAGGAGPVGFLIAQALQSPASADSDTQYELGISVHP